MRIDAAMACWKYETDVFESHIVGRDILVANGPRRTRREHVLARLAVLACDFFRILR